MLEMILILACSEPLFAAFIKNFPQIEFKLRDLSILRILSDDIVGYVVRNNVIVYISLMLRE